MFPEQIGPFELGVGVAGVWFTVIGMALEVAGLPVTPAKLDVNTQLTTDPLVSEVVVKVGPVPAFVPFTNHWNEGELPPLVADAVKVAVEPEQIGLLPEVCVILTPACTLAVTAVRLILSIYKA